MNEKDLAELSDEELLDAWTEKANEAEELKTVLRAFSQEHQRRTLKDNEAIREAALNSDDTQFVGRSEA